MCSHLSLAPTNEYNVYSWCTMLLLQMFVFPLVLMCHTDISLGLLLRRHPTVPHGFWTRMCPPDKTPHAIDDYLDYHDDLYLPHLHPAVFENSHKSASHPSNLPLAFLLSSYFHRLYGMSHSHTPSFFSRVRLLFSWQCE